jgi:FlaA1/EpsC-like NDP-sugar epimerase
VKSVLITGGSGTFGQAFTRYLLDNTECDRIVILSRGEFMQHKMAEAFKGHEDRLRFMIGDVRDQDRLKRAMRDIDLVVHAAALKRIEVGYYNPDEVIRTNVYGSENVVNAALDAGVNKAILLSSDKAYQPVSPYGTTKLAAESLFINANNMRGNDGTIFSVCRYGNVWGSTGSVAPKWKAIIEQGCFNTVPVTDPECTRFFMRMSEAIELVLRTCREMEGGEVNIPNLPAYRLGDLAIAMGVDMEIVGLPAWEKLHESMSEHRSSDRARRMTIQELQEAVNDL